jgi:hypothetical protein
MWDLYKLALEMEESSGYQLILKRGEAKGERRTLIRTILEQGGLKFGEPGEDRQAAIQQLTDHERLRELSRRIITATTWDELLA